MPATQPTTAEPSRQDPFRWARPEIANTLDTFSDPDHPSQRETAQRLGIPHEYAEFPGSHTWDYWDHHVQEAIAFHQRALGLGD